MTEQEQIKQRNSDFAHVFSGPRGERVLAYLSRYCLKKADTFIPGKPDQSTFNQGVRNVIIEIDHWIEFDLTTLEGTGEVDNIEPERKQDD